MKISNWQGRTQGGQEGPRPPLIDQFFFKKDQFLKKIYIFGQKNGILPPLNFFFHFTPL